MSDQLDFYRDIFAKFGTVHIRKMFGGYGIYHDGLMFALIADDTIYLKVDEQNKEEFQNLDLPQFEYPRKEKIIKMSYFQAPESIMEDQDEAKKWAESAYHAAIRNRKDKGKKK